MECDYQVRRLRHPTHPPPPASRHPNSRHPPSRHALATSLVQTQPRTLTARLISVAAHPPLARSAPTVEARPKPVLRVSTCRPCLTPGVRRRTSAPMHCPHPTARHPTAHVTQHATRHAAVAPLALTPHAPLAGARRERRRARRRRGHLRSPRHHHLHHHHPSFLLRRRRPNAWSPPKVTAPSCRPLLPPLPYLTASSRHSGYMGERGRCQEGGRVRAGQAPKVANDDRQLSLPR